MNYIQKARSILATKLDAEDDLFNLYTLLVFTKGIDCKPNDVHDAWAIWQNKTNPSHTSLIPFSKLTPEVQELDRERAEAIQKTAQEIGNVN